MGVSWLSKFVLNLIVPVFPIIKIFIALIFFSTGLINTCFVAVNYSCLTASAGLSLNALSAGKMAARNTVIITIMVRV